MTKKLNVELLQKVKSHILERPGNFDMEYFAESDECGTVACIAGWSAIIDKNLRYDPSKSEWLFGNNKTADIEEVAIKSLRLQDSKFEDQSGELFYLFLWPCDLAERYNRSRDSNERAQVAAERIDRFIAKYGEQR